MRPTQALQVIHGSLPPTLLRLLRSDRVHHALRRAAQAGSLYAVLWLAVGGWYEHVWELPGVTLRLLYTTAFTLTEYISRGWKPLFDEWTLGFEVSRNVSRAFMTHYGHRLGVARNAQIIRTQTAVAGTLMGWFFCRQHGTTTQSVTYNRLEHMWIKSASSASSAAATTEKTKGEATERKAAHRLVVLFFHGGGFAVNSPRMYIPFGSELQYRIQAKLQEQLGLTNDQEVQVEILLANYRKTPEHPHPIPPEDALVMYKYLIDDQQLSPQQIIVAGDSAGAGLAVSTMLRIRDNHPELMPLAGILSCPFVDLEMVGDERKVPYCILADKPCQSIFDTYHPREGHPTTWGDASPVHCDLSGLPPVYIQAAELDYILPHSKRLMQKALDDGLTTWHMEIFPHVPHVFTNFPPFILPSAAKGLDAMALFAATTFANALTGKDPEESITDSD